MAVNFHRRPTTVDLVFILVLLIVLLAAILFLAAGVESADPMCLLTPCP